VDSVTYADAPGAYAFGLDFDDVSRACYDEPPGAGG